MDVPVQVYLDSSDYSRLSETHLDPELRAVKEQLFRLRDEGACEYRYSYVHVLEMAPVDETAINASERRLGLAMELCGTRCLRSTDAIEGHELVRGVTNAERADVAYAFSDFGDWLPGGFEFLRRHAEALAGDVRSAAKRKGVRGQKAVAATALKLLLDQRLNVYGTKFPCPRASRRRIGAIPVGQFTAERVFSEMVGAFRDLPALSAWAVTATGAAVTRGLRERAAIPVQHLRTLRASIDEMVSTAENARNSKQQASAMTDQGMTEGLREFRCQRIAELVDASQDVLRSLGFSPDMLRAADLSGLVLPCLDVRLELYKENLQLNAHTNRSLNSALSDMPDVLHGCYLPYVDVFRVDRFAAGVFADQARRWRVSLVSDIRELPGRIQAAGALRRGH